MAHICFIDSTSTGLRGLRSARRLGHKATLFIPMDFSYLAMANMGDEEIRQFLGDGSIIRTHDSQADLLEKMQQTHNGNPFDAILTTCEFMVTTTAKMAKHFGTKYDTPEALERAVFKGRCRQVLRDWGVRSVHFAIASDCESALKQIKDVGYPAVVKPTRGTAKEASAIVQGDAELSQFFEAFQNGQKTSKGLEGFISGEFVIESYIDGTLHSAELIAEDGKVRLLTTTRRERAIHDQLIEVAAGMPSDLSPYQQEAVCRYFQQVFDATGLSIGIYHAEFIWSSGGPILVEINPRMMGGIAPILFERLTAVDPYEILIRLHLGSLGDEGFPVSDSGGGAVIAVGAPKGGILPIDARKRVERVLQKYDIIANTLKIEPGKALPTYQGNFSILGYLSLLAQDGKHALIVTSELLEDLESALGVELARIDPKFN